MMEAFNTVTALTLSDFLYNRRALVLSDRDGVVKTSAFLNEPSEEAAAAVMIPSALRAAAKLNESGVGLAIVTNQGGYQIGHNTFDDTVAINIRVSQQLANSGGHLDAIFICPFAEDLKDVCPGVYDARKPAGGMPMLACQLAAASDVPVLAMIGDQRTDGAAGQAAGLKFIAVTDSNGRWQVELKSAQRKHVLLPTLQTDVGMYQEVPAFANAVDILLAEEI
jgi:D-glycero-D-manno-heptose 1,7-bisphosphate phosphatase